MEFLWFLLIGLVAGWLAGQVIKGGGYGVIGDIVVGVIGALLGGWLFRVLGFSGLFGGLPDRLPSSPPSCTRLSSCSCCG